MCLTLAVPSVGLLVSLFGSVGQTGLAAAPPLCRLALIWQGGTELVAGPRVALDVLIVCFCMAVMGVGSVLAVQDIVRAWL